MAAPLSDSLASEPVPAASASAPAGGARAFVRFAWGTLAYLVLVILFGAWVRITGSGAGCGSHWPTCHGEIVPRSPTAETVIELTHRVTSGVLGVVVLALAVWAWVAFASRPRVRVAALLTLAFVIVEAAIGAGLVLAELVADDDSRARAVVVAIHLVSTLTLTASCGLTAWWAGEGAAPRFRRAPRVKWALVAAVAGVVAVCMTGAVTALGDTLFPVSPAESAGLLARLREDTSPAAHFLVRLRLVHPVLAVVVAGGLLALVGYADARSIGRRAARLLSWLGITVLIQTAAGVLNILMAAPGWLQIVHLLVAQIVWLLLVLAAAEVLAVPAAAPPRLHGAR